MASIFSKIIRGEIPCEKIYETNSEIAFLDIFPVTFGHTLVVAKREVARLEEVPVGELQSLMETLQKVAKAVSKAYDHVDYNIMLNNGPNAGQEVPHVHFHVIPSPERKSFTFGQRKKYQGSEMQEVGAKIRAALE